MTKYFPILKSKRGEFQSLNFLTPLQKSQTIPYIEVLPSLEGMTVNQLSGSWSFPDNEVVIDATHYFTQDNDADQFIDVLNTLRGNGVNAIPSVDPDSSVEYLSVVKDYLEEYNSKLAVRLHKRFLRPRAIQGYLNAIISEVGIPRDRLIVLVDSGNIDVNSSGYGIDKNMDVIGALGNLTDYYKVVSGSGSFPTDLNAFIPNTVTPITRYEWELWHEVQNNFEAPNICYADYGVKNPAYDSSLAVFEGSCSIKYTTENEYLIFRGVRASTHPLGGGQYHDKCQQVIAHPSYDGQNFSWGDNEIFECATRVIRPGNAETWVKIGHNHHFTKILSLL